MENNSKNVSMKNILILLVIVIVLLGVGSLVFSEVNKHQIRKDFQDQQEEKEISERAMLMTQIELSQFDLGLDEHTQEEMKQMSMYDLRKAAQELEWRKEYEALVRKCGDSCPDNLTWANYLLGKTFEE